VAPSHPWASSTSRRGRFFSNRSRRISTGGETVGFGVEERVVQAVPIGNARIVRGLVVVTRRVLALVEDAVTVGIDTLDERL
jgi:hypothetical protein